MTLSDLYSLNGDLTNYYQNAYETAARRLRLRPQAFPCVLTGSARLQEWKLPAYLLNDSEVAFKGVTGFPGCTLVNDDPGEYTIANLVIGDRTISTEFGLTDFKLMNDEFATIPELVVTDRDIVCTNLDEAFFWMVGYPFPYFVTVDGSTPYETEYVYSIASMVTTYGADNLNVDSVLMYPAIAYATASWRRDNGDLIGANATIRAASTYLNLYNESRMLFLPQDSDTIMEGTGEI